MGDAGPVPPSRSGDSLAHPLRGIMNRIEVQAAHEHQRWYADLGQPVEGWRVQVGLLDERPQLAGLFGDERSAGRAEQ